MLSMKYPFPPVILMWIYLLLSSFLLNEFCTSVAIETSADCVGLMCTKLKSNNVWTDVVVQTSIWSRDVAAGFSITVPG